jgi:hypothetical protein
MERGKECKHERHGTLSVCRMQMVRWSETEESGAARNADLPVISGTTLVIFKNKMDTVLY